MVRKRFTVDRDGDVLGLPLYLFILIIVVVFALAILAGWFLLLDSPSSIKTIEIDTGDGNDIIVVSSSSQSVSFKINVSDENGNPVEGALISLNGAGVRTTGVTDGHGTADFTVTVKLPGNVQKGKIIVEVEKTDYSSKSTEIMIRRV